jgi:uncharacterized protein (DUF3084 family)
MAEFPPLNIVFKVVPQSELDKLKADLDSARQTVKSYRFEFDCAQRRIRELIDQAADKDRVIAGLKRELLVEKTANSVHESQIGFQRGRNERLSSQRDEAIQSRDKAWQEVYEAQDVADQALELAHTFFVRHAPTQKLQDAIGDLHKFLSSTNVLRRQS